MKNLKTFKKWKIFLESLTHDDLDIVLDQFIEFDDMKHNTFQVRGVQGKRYKSGFGVEGKITDSGNIVVVVKCAYHFWYAVRNEIRKEVEPRLLDLGYKISQIKVTDSGETYPIEIPVSGRDYTHTSYDPVKKISVLIKKL